MMPFDAVATSPVAWSDWFVAGVGADIGGALMLALSFAAKRPSSLAEELVVVTRTYLRLGMGLASFAQSLARQKAESHIGLLFLVSGFAMQLFAYLWPHSSAITTNGQRLIAVVVVLAEWVLAAALWKSYVPWRTQREIAAAAAAGEALIAADAAGQGNAD
jgi:hypothetical protein